MHIQDMSIPSFALIWAHVDMFDTRVGKGHAPEPNFGRSIQNYEKKMKFLFF